MLYINRRAGESIVINDLIRVKIIEVKGKAIKLGFEFPQGAQIHREEVYQRILQENRAAALSSKILDPEHSNADF